MKALPSMKSDGLRVIAMVVVELSVITLATKGSGDAADDGADNVVIGQIGDVATDAAGYAIIGHIGGAETQFSNTMALGEGQLYLGLGPRLAVVDISDPAHPRITAQSEILPLYVPGMCRDCPDLRVDREG